MREAIGRNPILKVTGEGNPNTENWRHERVLKRACDYYARYLPSNHPFLIASNRNTHEKGRLRNFCTAAPVGDVDADYDHGETMRDDDMEYVYSLEEIEYRLDTHSCVVSDRRLRTESVILTFRTVGFAVFIWIHSRHTRIMQ